jgi:hypothetical protein
MKYMMKNNSMMKNFDKKCSVFLVVFLTIIFSVSEVLFNVPNNSRLPSSSTLTILYTVRCVSIFSEVRKGRMKNDEHYLDVLSQKISIEVDFLTKGSLYFFFDGKLIDIFRRRQCNFFVYDISRLNSGKWYSFSYELETKKCTVLDVGAYNLTMINNQVSKHKKNQLFYCILSNSRVDESDNYFSYHCNADSKACKDNQSDWADLVDEMLDDIRLKCITLIIYQRNVDYIPLCDQIIGQQKIKCSIKGCV